MSVLQHPALTRLWYGQPPAANLPPSQTNLNPNAPPYQPNPNAPPYQPNPTTPPINSAAQHVPERSHSPHSVDGSIVHTRRKNRARRGTENSLPVTFNPADISGDIGDDSRKDARSSEHTLARKDPFGTEIKRAQAKMDTKADYQVPFPQVQDMATVTNGGPKPRRTGAPQPISSSEQRDWEREQALRSPTLSAHSNTSSSHTTAPTSVSTANTTANSSVGAGAITIPGSYDTGSAGSGAEVTPTRENSKPKRGSAGPTAAAVGNNTGGTGVNSNSTVAPTGFTNQQLAQHIPSAPSPRVSLQQQSGYRASPPPLPSTGSPQARAVPTGSPSQPPRQAYAPPPPPPTMASTTQGSSSLSDNSYEPPPTLASRTSYTTMSSANPLPTLPDSPPSPDPTRLADMIRSPPYTQQHLGQHVGPIQTALGGFASILQPQQVPISPLHPRPTNRTQAPVLGPTKMAESWTAAPTEELDDEARERKIHLGGARDGTSQRDRGHRGTGVGSIELKDGNWGQGQAPERQGSVRRPKPATQSSTASVAPVQTQQQVAPSIARTATMPIATRYETMSPPPIRDPHAGLHLDFQDNRSIPEKPAPAPAPTRSQTGRGPSPVPRQSPGDQRRDMPRAQGTTPPYTYDDQTYGRGRSASHNTYTTSTQPKAAPPPPVAQGQWAGRAPGTGIVPFNEDLDHDEHEQQPVPPVVQQPMLQSGKSEQSIVDWANHTNSQHPLTHPNQPQPVPPGLAPIPAAPPAAPQGERGRGRSRSRGRGDQSQVQPPLMDPASIYSQQQQQQQQQTQPQIQTQIQNITKSPEARPGGRSPVPAPVASAGTRGNTGSGSSEAEDLKTPRSPSVPLPNDGYPRFGYGQFSVGHPGTINHIYTQDLGQNGQMYPSMGFAQSQYALQQMGAGPQGMMGQMNGYHINGRQVNGRDTQHQNQNGYYGYPQDLSSSASGSFLDGWTSNQMDARGYPTHARPSAPVPPTPSTTAPSAISGEIRNGTQGHMARAQTVLYNAQTQLHPQQAYPPYNYAQAQMSYAMDPYRAPSVVSSFMASPFSHNPFLPPVAEPQSTQSSPSHQPVGLPYGPGPAPKRFGGARLGTKSMARRRRAMEEFRPESTVPNDTASEAETEGKGARHEPAETEFETETEMEEVWLEESDDDELGHEFHPSYFVNPAKRKRRFEQKWEQMVKLFREIDRETDATMILAAAPPDQHQTHLLLSRSILRDTHYSHIAQEARAVFSEISVARRHERAEALRRARQDRQRKKLIDDRLNQIMHENQERAAQGGIGSGSDETSIPHPQTDEELRVALDKAVNSLQEMRRVFEDMETRHREESNRRKEESLSIEKLLTTLLANKSVPAQSSS